jgi:exonuclease III
MNVATFRINNVDRRLPNLLAWVKTDEPDAVCLRELGGGQRLYGSRTAGGWLKFGRSGAEGKMDKAKGANHNAAGDAKDAVRDATGK